MKNLTVHEYNLLQRARRKHLRDCQRARKALVQLSMAYEYVAKKRDVIIEIARKMGIEDYSDTSFCDTPGINDAVENDNFDPAYLVRAMAVSAECGEAGMTEVMQHAEEIQQELEKQERHIRDVIAFADAEENQAALIRRGRMRRQAERDAEVTDGA